MEKIQEEPVAKAKTHRSKEQIAICLKEQQRSGLTIKEYSEGKGISENTFYRWQKIHGKRKQRKRKKPFRAQGGFTSIEVVSTAAANKPQLFAEIGNIKLYKEVTAEYLKTLLS